jgi:HSP20 family protein
MRLRYRHMTYRYIDGTQNQLTYHYHQLVQEALHQSHQALLQRSKTWRPLADICESAAMMTVKIELAGMKEEDIDVTLYEDALVISGDRHEDHESQEGLYYHEAQIRYGPFRVEVPVPSPIDRDAVTARYENGFLSVHLPKLPASKPERVPIQRNDQGE